MPSEIVREKNYTKSFDYILKQGLSECAAEQACQVSNSTVEEYLERAKKARLCCHCLKVYDEDIYHWLYSEDSISNPKPMILKPSW